MGILTDNPVLGREVRGRLRLRRKGAAPGSIPWLGWILGVVIAYFYARGLIGVWHGKVQDAQEFWTLLVYGLLGLIVLLSPALSATAITQEREQQTWDSLATTNLTAREILLGKWIGRQTIPWLLIALAAPYLLGCAVRGDIPALSMLAVLFFLLVTTGFYSMLGLFCSFQAKRTAAATAASLTLTALLCVGTAVIDGVISLFLPHSGSSSTFALRLNPFYALNALLAGLNQGNPQSQGGYVDGSEPYGDIASFYLVLTPLLTLAAIGFMVSRYRRAVRERS